MPDATPARDIAVSARFLLPGGALEGIGRFTDEVVQRLVRDHPECRFHLLFDRAFDERYRYADNVVPHVLRPPARHPVLWWWWYEVSVASWLTQHRPAAFLSTDGFTTLRTRTPRVTVIHDLGFEHFPDDVRSLHGRFYRRFTPRYVAASERTVAVSEATRADLVATYGADPDRIVVAGNAVGPDFTPPSPSERSEIRRRFTDGEPYVLFVGAMQPRKNLVTLLRAFDEFVEQTGSPVLLVLAGRVAWKSGATLDAFDRMRHRDRVRLTGWVDDSDLPALYGAAAATVFVPLFEGFGIPVLEAQASGSAVLTSSCSSLPEVAGDGALLVDPTSVAAVRDGLTRIVLDEGLRQQLVARGHDNVARYSWDETAVRVWREIERVADLHQSAR